MQYWNLRWWDNCDGSYTYPYRETNRQAYILRKKLDGWKVFENLRPSPRISVPLNFRDALALADEDIKENWKSYQEAYLKGR